MLGGEGVQDPGQTDNDRLLEVCLFSVSSHWIKKCNTLHLEEFQFDTESSKSALTLNATQLCACVCVEGELMEKFKYVIQVSELAPQNCLCVGANKAGTSSLYSGLIVKCKRTEEGSYF